MSFWLYVIAVFLLLTGHFILGLIFIALAAMLS